MSEVTVDTQLTSAREIVTNRITQRARRFPDFDLSPIVVDSLSSRDAALAKAIDHAVARRWLTLVAVIESQLSRPWENTQPPLQAALLVGAAQLLLLERLPDHAVIHEAVQWTKSNVISKAGGLVNAVLRCIAELRESIVNEHNHNRSDELPLHDGRAWRLSKNIFSDDPTIRLAQTTGHSTKLITYWQDTFGRDQAQQIAYHNLVHAPIIIQGLNQKTETCVAHDGAGSFVFNGTHDELLELLKAQPQARVQDSTSAAPINATAELTCSLIIDLCAGMGTKTKQLALVHPDARILATDKDDNRRTALQKTVTGSKQIEVVQPQQLDAFANRADLVVLDVPCSNSGVLARRVEAKYRLSEDSLEQLTKLQRQIIIDGLRLLNDTGHLLYATCSIEECENEDQARWIEKWHRMRIVKQVSRLPRGGPGELPTTYCDGGYYALMSR